MNYIQSLINKLNEACEAYYSGKEPIMTDYEFDKLYDELVGWEKETGVVFENSPTKNVGWHHVLKQIDDVTLSHKMLSLNKAHTVAEITSFIGENPAYASVKCDGLSCTLTYKNGQFISAATRGNGAIGSDVTNAILAIKNVPKRIKFYGDYIIDGEIIIYKEDFERINANQPEDKKFKNPRNLAAGTLTMLDNQVIRDRLLSFVAWRVIQGYGTNSNQKELVNAGKLGFQVVPMTRVTKYNNESLAGDLETIRKTAEEAGIPYDGAVIAIDSVSVGNSLGSTDKFPKHSIAYKYEDELAETTLLDIEWNTSKTGAINPIAVFEDVELEGTTVNKATLHNPDYIKQLELGIGDTIVVRKANAIIPRVEENLTRSDTYQLPTKCPSCGGKAVLTKTDKANILMCTNPDCPAKMVAKLVHFCSRDALDVEGLSEATIEVLSNKGWLNSFEDIFRLKDHEREWKSIPGFGKKSVENILAAIEKSRTTTLERFIYSLSIPLIGKTASKDISKFCGGDFKTFINTRPVAYKKIGGFGDRMVVELSTYLTVNGAEVESLAKRFNFKIEEKDVSNPRLSGLTFVITGDVHIYKNRKELQADIEKHGGKVTGSVSAKTNYLINNDINSNSSKNLQAKKLGIPIITEEEISKMLGGESAIGEFITNTN